MCCCGALVWFCGDQLGRMCSESKFHARSCRFGGAQGRTALGFPGKKQGGTPDSQQELPWVNKLPVAEDVSGIKFRSSYNNPVRC